MPHTKATILLVEDEELLRAGVQEVLEIQGYKVITAPDGEQALACLGAQTIDLIITDLVMPKMDGVDFVKQLRKIKPDLPVIVVSGSTRNIMQRYGIDSIQVPGANASLPKPFKSVDLIEQVRQLLASRP
ncbi:response regulator [Limnohabitans sp. 63ED37-2]|uniref:response regulator n=1 Tax=Limnohabitans sp. 63ED37-2 TaxID=1678128 RepID=UPI000705E3D2|nr:response regulator [Limnohabitans sp. 63ED37-2]ALK88963.1 Response regulator MprA [Limnohabitans sp. 63ED37-2]